MTENQEKELFITLANLVTGVNFIQSDLKIVQSDINVMKADIDGIKVTLADHSQILGKLDAKTDSLAEKVLDHETRLTRAEENIEELQSNIH